jgi:hypothetical protein
MSNLYFMRRSASVRKALVRAFTLCAVLACIAIGFAKPVLTTTKPESQKTWVQVFNTASPDPRQQSSDEAFGRQLDALTAFYSTVISLIIGMLALIGALAFFTIRLVSRNAAEDIAIEAAQKIVKDSREFHAELTKTISTLVEARFEELDQSFEEVNGQIEALTDALQKLRTEEAAETTPEATVTPPLQQPPPTPPVASTPVAPAGGPISAGEKPDETGPTGVDEPRAE